MNDRDFANYQRIMAAYPAQSMALLGFYISVSIAGGAGLFALTQAQISASEFRGWALALSILCLFVTLMLWAIWFREHALKDQAVSEVKAENVRFPSTPNWTGVATGMITVFFLSGGLVWLVLLVSLLCKAQFVLNLHNP